MKQDKRFNENVEKGAGLSEKEFIEYLEERFRKLKLDEQKFRDEVLTKHSVLEKNLQYAKEAR